jgi:hypothetical protein
VSYSVIISAVITSGVQALAGLLGYLISRVPHPLFFATVTFFTAFVPTLGAASVCVFAAGILFVTGHPYRSLFLALWGVVVVGLVDNVIKPLLIKAGMEMRSAVVFFALIGGPQRLRGYRPHHRPARRRSVLGTRPHLPARLPITARAPVTADQARPAHRLAPGPDERRRSGVTPWRQALG